MGLFNPVAGIQRKTKSVAPLERKIEIGREGVRERESGWIYPESVRASWKSKRNDCAS